MAAVAGLAACGAADEPVDPGSFALRDLLGVAPRVAVAWDRAQRSAARQVLAGGLDASDPIALGERGALADDTAVVAALAAVDDRRLDADQDALGLVVTEAGAADGARAVHAVDAVDAAAWLHGDAIAAPTITLELDAGAWPCPTGAPCDLDVLATLAAAAAPGAARVRVVPAPTLPTIAALWIAADGTPTLLVNPIVTAVGAAEPVTATTTAAASGTSLGGGAGGAGPVPAFVSRAPVVALPLITATWTYDPSVAACAAAVQRDCQTCLAGGLCEPIWPSVSGMEACIMLDADVRNYSLLCANLALSLADVANCVVERGSSCVVDGNAIGAPASLAANAQFLDDQVCAESLAVCLDQFYGATDSSNGCSCGSCDCGSCDCSGNSCDNNANTDSGQCGSMDNTGGCNNGGCGDSSGNGCGGSGSGGGCSSSGGGGSCAVARAPAGRSALPIVGLAWVLVPVPVGLLARRRARRRGARPTPVA